MPKATVKLTNGTVIEIDGSQEEVQKLLQIYGAEVQKQKMMPPKKQSNVATKLTKASSSTTSRPTDEDFTEIVNLVKTCDEAEAIGAQILDRTSEVNRVLLPLYIINQYMDDVFGLTTVEIGTITTELGIRVFRQNALRALTTTGSRYVISDRVRKKGQATRYKINRRGVQYIKEVFSGDTNAE